MAIHRHILHNGEIRKASETSLSPGQAGLLSGWGVFSTLRVRDGALFAWPRHWARLTRDAKLMNVALPKSADLLELDLLRLLEANGIEAEHGGDCTLRVVIVRNGGAFWEGPGNGLASDTIALTADLKAWGKSVRLGIEAHARHAASEFSRAKILSWSQNLRWAERAQENGFDEVVLLNEYGRVAECTSANIFAVLDGRVITPPQSEGCLPGITREVLLEAIRVPGVEVTERPLEIDDLYKASEVFITSSTRDLLGVSEVGGKVLKQNGGIRELLAAAFRSFLHDDIESRRRHTFASFR